MQPQYGSPPPYVPPTPSPSGHDPYQFIVDPAKAPRKRIVPTGNSTAGRLVIGLASLFVLLIIFVVVKDLLGGSGGLNQASLINVAQDQTELIHLSTGGVQDAVSETTKNFAITTQLATTSQLNSLLAYLKAHGIKGSSSELTLKQSPAIDSQLNAALATTTFDPTFTSIMQSGLATYEKDLKQAYTLNSGVNARALLQTDYTGAALLAKQLVLPTS